MRRHILAASLAALLATTLGGSLHAQRFDARGLTFQNAETRWIDSVMERMSLEERIAQLMVVRVPLDMTDSQTEEFSRRMNGYDVGGVCFFVGTAERQVVQTRRLQADAKLPLLVTIDGEWGLGMRLKDCFSFPRNARFGLLPREADTIVRRMGEEIGRQCRDMGIHINFAPVVDINSNPKNPVIGTRSFGTDRERVSQLGIQYMLGQQSQGVMAVAKHFPGHGDTDADSHLELPVINHTMAYIDTIDTYPFKRLVEAGVGGVMVAHLQVNAYDRERPSSLSPVIVNGLLRRELGFDGLVITDGIDMKGVTNSYKDGNAELMALLAGNDIILLPPDVPKSIEVIKKAAQHTDSVRRMVDYHCRRVLQAKYRLVLPRVGEEIHVPGAEHEAVCRQIVTDLNFSVDHTVDSLARAAIDAGATPGCQVVVMHRGRVVMDRAYGRQTYDQGSPAIDGQTLYDLASLTKVASTTLAIMKLVDEGRISVKDPLGKYLPYLDSTDKASLTIEQVMSHQAGFRASCPFWMSSDNRDTILSLVAASKLNAKAEYLYSDLGFMLLGDLVNRVCGKPMEEYVAEHFYRPMGLTRTLFRPLAGGVVDKADIAPTELDTLRGLIHGEVHDPNAYAMGGVSGHAGLFSNAREVALIFQMLLNGGELDGRRYLSSAVVSEFTSRHFTGNRRALGFDKPLLGGGSNGPCSSMASQASFGHTGFTGTMVWADPQTDLVYVFLSNRVHPSATPNKLVQMNTRTDIQSAIYKLIK